MRIKDHREFNGHSVEPGTDVVRLNITNATVIDDGLWNCTVSTVEQQSWDIVLLQIQLTVIGEVM